MKYVYIHTYLHSLIGTYVYTDIFVHAHSVRKSDALTLTCKQTYIHTYILDNEKSIIQLKSSLLLLSRPVLRRINRISEHHSQARDIRDLFLCMYVCMYKCMYVSVY